MTKKDQLQILSSNAGWYRSSISAFWQLATNTQDIGPRTVAGGWQG